jgi:hypothetical protein
MERNLALKTERRVATKSASHAVDKAPLKEAPNLIPDLHNGGRVVVGWLVPPLPTWVVFLPSGQAALAVVAWFYGGGEVAGYEMAA